MQRVNDTPLPPTVTVPSITPGPSAGFVHGGILYWRPLVGGQPKNINTVDGTELPDSYFASDLVDHRVIVGIHDATPA